MFFDQVPPDTSAYMVAGYMIFFVVTAIYVASFFIRARNLSRDLETLNDVQQEQQPPAPVAASARQAAPAAAAPRARTAKAKAARTKTTKTKQASRKSVKKR